MARIERSKQPIQVAPNAAHNKAIKRAERWDVSAPKPPAPAKTGAKPARKGKLTVTTKAKK